MGAWVAVVVQRTCWLPLSPPDPPLRALQPIPPGAEVLISYGATAKCSEALMRDYGFCLPANANDRISFSSGAVCAEAVG